MEKGFTNKKSKAEKKEVLLPYCFRPEEHPEVIYHNQEIVIICDKFPKARFHWLIMPKGTVLVLHSNNGFALLLFVILYSEFSSYT
jgi:hypothetical protein